ncbi:Aldose 1-epimerase [Propionicimonas sp. T2.31MG-18]|uniref:aldose epimerase family protein n=1 Tax=Propionicimonas sp. T2.31MG-18 TaxID=3157620 RepID=UPI0035E9B27E
MTQVPDVCTDSMWLVSHAVRLELLPLGATLRRFEVLRPDGSWRNIVLGSRHIPDYLGRNLYLGMTIGRYANRIARARFTLDGVENCLDANEGRTQLHGGTGGFHARTWEISEQTLSTVEFSLVSPDGDQGFPGELLVSVRYELLPGGAQVTYRATTDEATVVNLTNHAYFNLKGEGCGSTDDHELVVHASGYTPAGSDLIPTGEVRDVTGSAADFRGGQLLGPSRAAAVAEGIALNEGWDHNFVVDGDGFREHCRLTGPDGTVLRILSDQPAIQVYCGDHFDGSQIGTSGRPYARRAGIALETQHFPDSPNQPAFPTTVLRPDEEYTSTTRWLVE